MILDDSAEQDVNQKGHQQRVSELSGVPNAQQYNEYNSNMSADNTRMGNSDIGLLNSKIPGGY